jgi:hypothetical protein
MGWEAPGILQVSCLLSSKCPDLIYPALCSLCNLVEFPQAYMAAAFPVNCARYGRVAKEFRTSPIRLGGAGGYRWSQGLKTAPRERQVPLA